MTISNAEYHAEAGETETDGGASSPGISSLSGGETKQGPREYGRPTGGAVVGPRHAHAWPYCMTCDAQPADECEARGHTIAEQAAT